MVPRKYGKAVDYSSLLGEVVKTPTERVNLMKSYFEPTEEERQSHLKEPTKAHRAIAKMAKNGYLRVVLTTNFDRLLEKALNDEGITPQVICHEDDIEGATPLVHSSFTIVKSTETILIAVSEIRRRNWILIHLN